ncbi:MAG: hypothetical protein SF028_13190 [Candidatus Sumerlaeia bacterium]|nr:hypothetical protein [Candidatus Sumerlaeia bacterium]
MVLRPRVSLLVCLCGLLVAMAGAQTATVSFQTPASVIFPDLAANCLRRADNGESMPFLLAASTNTNIGRYYLIPKTGAFAQPLTLLMRFEGFPDGVGSIGADEFRALSWTGPQPTFTIVNAAYGQGGANFVEVLVTLTAYVGWGSNDYYFLGIDEHVYGEARYATFVLSVSEPFAIEEAPADPGHPIDRRFRLLGLRWPDEFTNCSPMPPAIYRGSDPLAGETVEISGTGVRFTPESASTDAEGYFTVAAFVAPEEFEAGRERAEPRADALGSLQMKYRELIRTHGISGQFCVVIMVDGVVNVQYRGPVVVGEVLRPGTVLSLSAQQGKRASLGLRFVNGTDASIVQDVFTNACITDLIKIGNDGIEDASVIPGNSRLGTVSRYLCEKVAGLPTTPAQWATFTGKVVVTGAASSVVSVGGITGFALKYAVKQASGESYDWVVNSTAGGSRGDPAPLLGAGPPRVDLATYYDGSTRVAQSLGPAVAMFPAGSATPAATVPAGVWREFAHGGAPQRDWSETPDSIDLDGPRLQLAVDSDLASGLSTVRLAAWDPSGLDVGTLAALINGTAATGLFEQRGEGAWEATLFGNLSGAHIEATIADLPGNTRALD